MKLGREEVAGTGHNYPVQGTEPCSSSPLLHQLQMWPLCPHLKNGDSNPGLHFLSLRVVYGVDSKHEDSLGTFGGLYPKDFLPPHTELSPL